MSLESTLKERPDLAAVVRTLEIETTAESQTGVPKSKAAPDRKAVCFRQTDMVGNILLRSINLQRLELSIFRDLDAANSKPYDPRAYIDDETGALFNKTFPIQQLSSMHNNLSLVPGLRRLVSLSMFSRSIDWAWCTLPLLKRLQVGQHCKFTGIFGALKQSSVEEMILNRDTYVLFTPTLQNIDMFLFLGGFSKLVKLEIKLCNTVIDELRGSFQRLVSRTHWGSFEHLISAIIPVASTLEYLVIRACAHHKCVGVRGCVHPVRSMTSFKRLRILKVPYEVLLDAQYRPAATILPASLEKLWLHKPQFTVFPVLEDIAAYPQDLPSLKRIELVLHRKRGVAFEDARYRRRDVWDQLRGRGIDCRLWTSQSAVREEWNDKNYDPFIGEIVDFLESLKGATFVT